MTMHAINSGQLPTLSGAHESTRSATASTPVQGETIGEASQAVMHSTVVPIVDRNIDRSSTRGTTALQAVPATKPSTATLLKIINSAKSTLCMNINSVQGLEPALQKAADRGVKMQFFLQEFSPNNNYTRRLRENISKYNVDTIIGDHETIPRFTMIADGVRGISRGHALTKAAAEAMYNDFQKVFVTKPNMKGFGVKAGEARLFPEPDVGAAQFIGELANAKKSIDVSIYILDYPSVINELKKKAAEGVKVRVMIETHPVGGGNANYVINDLKKAGVEAKGTPPKFDAPWTVDHAKLALIDGKTAIMSTGNFRRSSLGGHLALTANDRDFLIVDRTADGISDAKKLFKADWNRQDSTKIHFKKLVVSPDNAKPRALAFINRQKKRLYFYNQSLKDKDVIAALIKAKQRGVDVRVLVADRSSNDEAIKTLQQAGIPAGYCVHYYLHAKAMAGDTESYAGSQNFNAGGLGGNRDLGDIVQGKATADALAKVFLEDSKTAVKALPEQEAPYDSLWGGVDPIVIGDTE